MTKDEIIKKLRANKNPKNIVGMARFGINSKNTLGINIPILRKMAKNIGKNHELAIELWDSNVHEAQLLATFIDDPKMVNIEQMNRWVTDFDSWDVCDQACMSLFDKTPFAFKMAKTWANHEREFTRRAGFALMAALAFHDKITKDKDFIIFFPLIKKYSVDERNFVKKAVNWALRQIGKRNLNLRNLALVCAKDIIKINSKSAKWIANDAIRELESVKIISQIRRKNG